ncbi:Smr/MutS family protein [Salegentibacter sediminis]|uniref:Smr/MutS family protein n=1 Tax=Salegentibacter sediminis TaxID=1930251 RepID=UPI0009BEE21F|nr:Smr/MutS family protein [Salegentibacter sediminis]
MKFNPGDKVAALDDDLEGVVVNADAASVTIETPDGFEMDFSPAELVKIETPIEDLSENVDFNRVLEEKQLPKKPKSKRIKPKERNAPPMEVDLHIEKLVNNFRGMNNFDILNLQMETAKRQLEFAMRKRIQKIVFIHGVGEGVLKAELDYLLGRYDNLKFYDADYQKYGQGATEVYFFQNN